MVFTPLRKLKVVPSPSPATTSEEVAYRRDDGVTTPQPEE